ncbi:hypothetical protein Tco_0212420 [Tanacetum coccineum]
MYKSLYGELSRHLDYLGLEYGRYGVSKILDTAYRGFLGSIDLVSFMVFDSGSSCLEALKKYDNVLPLTERQLVQYLQKVSRVLYNILIKDQWEKYKEAAVSYADLMSEIKGFHNAAYKVHRGTEDAFSTYEKLLVNFQAQYDTSEIKSMMTEIFKAFKVQYSSAPSTSVQTTTLVITKGPTIIRGRILHMLLLKNLLRTLKGRIITWKLKRLKPPLTDTILEIPIPQPTGLVIDITPPEEPESPLVVPKGDKRKDVATKETEEPIMKLVPTSREVIQEEATKVGVDPKILSSAKGGQEFKKIQDADRLKPKPATDVKIHPNTKPAVLTIYRGNDRRNFDVYNPFKFADFGITKLNKIPEELGIQSALPTLVQAQSQSSGRKRKHME